MKAFLALSCMAAVSMAGAAAAAPVTLAFEAEIASIVPIGGGVDLPFEIEIGDTLAVTFNTNPEIGRLRIQTPEFILEKANYSVVIKDNNPDWIPLTGRIADPANTPAIDRGPGGVSDLFRVGCAETNELSLCETTPLDGGSTVSWIPHISLIGESEILSSNALPVSLSTLNAFSFREMSLTFFDFAFSDFDGRMFGSGIIVGAFVGEIRAVPEPASAFLIGTWLAMLYCTGKPHRARE